uniref:Uncharacterized protein n=1 Tax=Panstrongylus lignarius TaxID=156445 RepID=A0A224Y5I9_9HEMI
MRPLAKIPTLITPFITLALSLSSIAGGAFETMPSLLSLTSGPSFFNAGISFLINGCGILFAVPLSCLPSLMARSAI